MQKRGDGALLIETVRCREGEHIDAHKIAIGAGLDEPLDGVRRLGIGGLTQRCEQGFGVAHGRNMT